MKYTSEAIKTVWNKKKYPFRFGLYCLAIYLWIYANKGEELTLDEIFEGNDVPIAIIQNNIDDLNWDNILNEIDYRDLESNPRMTIQFVQNYNSLDNPQLFNSIQSILVEEFGRDGNYIPQITHLTVVDSTVYSSMQESIPGRSFQFKTSEGINDLWGNLVAVPDVETFGFSPIDASGNIPNYQDHNMANFYSQLEAVLEITNPISDITIYER